MDTEPYNRIDKQFAVSIVACMLVMLRINKAGLFLDLVIINPVYIYYQTAR